MLGKALAFAALIALNVALFYAPIDYTVFGSLAYVGAFVVTFLANAAIIVPIPYIPIIAHLTRTVELPLLIVVLGAAGSALGESVAFFVGRAQKDLLAGQPRFERLKRFFGREWRAALFLFFFAIPLNPAFDIGGLAAGALGVSFRTFFVAVGLGRLIRLAIIALLAEGLLAMLARFSP